MTRRWRRWSACGRRSRTFPELVPAPFNRHAVTSPTAPLRGARSSRNREGRETLSWCALRPAGQEPSPGPIRTTFNRHAPTAPLQSWQDVPCCLSSAIQSSRCHVADGAASRGAKAAKPRRPRSSFVGAHFGQPGKSLPLIHFERRSIVTLPRADGAASRGAKAAKPRRARSAFLVRTSASQARAFP